MLDVRHECGRKTSLPHSEERCFQWYCIQDVHLVCAFPFLHASDVILLVHFLSHCYYIYHFSPSQDWITITKQAGNFHAVRSLGKTHTKIHTRARTHEHMHPVTHRHRRQQRLIIRRLCALWPCTHQALAAPCPLQPCLLSSLRAWQPLHHLHKKPALGVETIRVPENRTRFNLSSPGCCRANAEG